MRDISEYEPIVGHEIISKLREHARTLRGAHIVYINSTYVGGGVAEMLNSVVPLFNEIGIKMGWRILHGTDDFFTITKKIHNSLQGGSGELTVEEKGLYERTNRLYSTYTHLDHDLVVVHDPQPMPLIKFYKKAQPWILRLHIDITNPNPNTWDYIRNFVEMYDEVVVSNKNYMRPDLNVPQSVIYPAIDPLSLKNIPLSDQFIDKELAKFGVSGKPMIAQVSRFDKWKDPLGVIKIFEKVRRKFDCQLVLLGNLATDDPEGQKIFESVQLAAAKSEFKRDINVILVESETLVNAVQTRADVIVQNSIREGFGLVVTEAMYKGTPVVASDVGGIKVQIEDGYNGYLVDHGNYDEFSSRVLELLRDPEKRKELGEHGRKTVVDNFLITRLMDDWMTVFERHLKSGNN